MFEGSEWYDLTEESCAFSIVSMVEVIGSPPAL
jgi:hypothetical protein